MVAAGIGFLSFLIWVYLFTRRGQFWRVSNSASELDIPLISPPRVAVVIPARNEADVVGQAVRSLLEQDYAGPAHIFLVDDHSSDETANLARWAAADKTERLTISLAMPLPAGWTGKMLALSQGVEQASEFAPDYFLFTDADIVHARNSITSLVALAQRDNLDLVSMMARLPLVAIFYTGATIHSAIRYWLGHGGRQPVFTYVRDSAARVDVKQGDARLLLEGEAARAELQQFDVLVLDAFSGDAVPVHLLTSEAFDTYWQHLNRVNGVIAIHVSSRHIDLLPVLEGLTAHYHAYSLVRFTDGSYPYLGEPMGLHRAPSGSSRSGWTLA